jgi:hypothetical protein
MTLIHSPKISLDPTVRVWFHMAGELRATRHGDGDSVVAVDMGVGGWVSWVIRLAPGWGSGYGRGARPIGPVAWAMVRPA